MQTVLEICDRKGDWRFYDENFCRLVANSGEEWGNVHLERYLKSMLAVSGPAHDNSHKPHTNVQSMPKGSFLNIRGGEEPVH